MLAHFLLCENTVFEMNREQVDRPIIISKKKVFSNFALSMPGQS
jgi:hypothetical protein